jgi:predicted RNase H-like nuclease (RuvC/YqgF family)
MSKTEHIYLKDLHSEHKEWISAIHFGRDEIKTFKHRLEEVASKNTDKDFAAQLEHFQNQMIRHGEVFDTLEHNIKEHEHELKEYAEDHPIAIDHVHFTDHKDLRESVEQQNKIFRELKDELNRFLSKYM